MSVFKFAVISAFSMGLLAGCQTSDPAYQEQKAQQRAAASASVQQTVAQEFGPLMPLCFANLTQGTPLDDTKMASLGYKRALVGYKKPRGSSAMDRINMANTTVQANGKTCSLGLGNFAGVQEAGAYLRAELKKRGYTEGPRSQNGFTYTKGNQTLYLNGVFYGTVTNVSISK